jgi:hypothetical protein
MNTMLLCYGTPQITSLCLKLEGALGVFKVNCRNKDKTVSYFGMQNVVQCDVMLRRLNVNFILACYDRFLSSIAVNCIVEIGKVATVRAGEVGSVIYNEMNL